jgi:hypothetical protein
VSRRRGLALAALALAAAVALGLWLAREDADAASAPAVAAAAAPPPPPVAAAAPATGAPASRPLPPLDSLPEPVRRLLEATPYPPTSGRLLPGQEELLHPNGRYETHRPIPDTLSHDPTQVVTWRFSADRWAYTGPDVVHAFLEVRRGGKAIEVDLASATAVREGSAGPEGARVPLHFRRDGRDLVADVPLHPFADHHGAIVFEVRFEYERGRFHEDALRLFYTPANRIPAEITGAARDSVREGSLVVPLGVDVGQAGFYRFDANVYGPDGQPVAFTSWKGELESGVREIPLEVYGKVLRDAGVPGPYTISEIRGYRFLDGQYPDREHLLDLPGQLTTESYPLGVFTDVRHDSPHELALAAMLLDDLAKGIGVAPPPIAGGGAAPAAALAAEPPRPPDDDAEVALPRPEPGPAARRVPMPR